MAHLSPATDRTHTPRTRRVTLTRHARPRLWVAALAMVTAVPLGVVVNAAPAGAVVPGPQGRIAFARFDPLIGDDATYTANPDGSHLKRLFPGASGGPHWSPNGRLVEIGACADPPVCDTAAVLVDPRT